MCLRVCLFVFVFLECQEQSAQGKHEKNGENFAAKCEKTRTRFRAAVVVLCSHNVRNVAQCVTTCKKKMRAHAIYFRAPYFRPALTAYSANASDTRECASLIDASALCFSMSDSKRFPAAS